MSIQDLRRKCRRSAITTRAEWTRRQSRQCARSHWRTSSKTLTRSKIAKAVQGGLGMPDRDYYTKTDEASKKLRYPYVDHVAKMLTLLGEPAATASDQAKKILALETKLAEASRTRVQLRDPQKNYNKMPLSQLQKLTPDWNWSDYFRQINLLEPPNINVHQPEFFKTADDVFKSAPIEDWKAYL